MIAICTTFYKDIKELERYIYSLTKTTKNEFLIFIACNAEDKEEVDKCLELGNRSYIRILHMYGNKGLGVALNYAVDEALQQEADYIVVTDPDIEILTEGWDEKMINLLKNPEVGYVCTNKNCGQTWRIRREKYLEVDVAIGCLTMIKRKTIEDIRMVINSMRGRLEDRVCDARKNTKNLMYADYLTRVYKFISRNNTHVDEGYFYGVLDYDSSLLVRWAGYKIAVAEDVDLIHHCSSENPDKTAEERRKKLTHDSWNYYRVKWGMLMDWVEWTGKINLWDDIPLNRDFHKEVINVKDS